MKSLKLFVDVNRYNPIVRGLARVRGLLFFHENSSRVRPMGNPIPLSLMEMTAYTRLYDHFMRYYMKYTGKKNRVLDVGCGGEKRFYSVYGPHMAEEYVGVDPDLTRTEMSDSTLFMPGVAENLQCDSEYFDVVLLLSVLDHVSSLSQSLFEAHRVLQVSGHAWVVSSVFKNRADIDQTYANAHKRSFTRSGVETILRAGFQDVRVFKGIGKTVYAMAVKKTKGNGYPQQTPGMFWEERLGW